MAAVTVATTIQQVVANPSLWRHLRRCQRANGFDVSDTAYFVYTNGRLDAEGFFDKVEFRTKIIPYKGSDKWIDPTLKKMKACLEGNMPAVGMAAMGGECDYCLYSKSRTELTLKDLQNKKKV